ncbi:copper resistance protein NlpE [Pseudobacter ginsenosidimutans]|uniref:Putative lipoprotein NlpE involved in copper resistance n=1 Tax=Pseudobacter ginsenosidimutans TaxID=661488 RepID=A0A4Q7MV54_9BACT|nr:copper resistance protein NlpE [Pseudobacter ginsenosidimutans]QEC40731.1 copper resistance protein NlpE [Pseudobacter ginsenosidimutans]RZS72547.1 putative lipoprotein NlpE involved in copper resistance [Pseudobacter ginsenosidimutans]
MNRTLVMMAIAASLSIAACNDPGKQETATADNAADTSAVSQPVDMHNAANSLDLAGEYEGTLPCADCEGIKTTLNLNKDSLFTLKEEYLGKKSPAAFNSKGKWVVHKNTITLQFDKELQDRRVQYKAGENKLWLLDQEGKEITGTLADKYIMTKK